MTTETILRRLAAICRENIAAFADWETKTDHRGVPLRSGAKGEARGTVATSREILAEIRRLRRKAPDLMTK